MSLPCPGMREVQVSDKMKKEDNMIADQLKN